ncbi:hypothetical protein [Deinococcus sp. Leaf326]|uniref:hypothetical protein n=1 Tax=Deinococcus sp. Leaf326 TaxID=1736338 RepID=UPI0012E15D86|nr:hypothetical protein [Deinococcus sp. Leaf326]
MNEKNANPADGDVSAEPDVVWTVPRGFRSFDHAAEHDDPSGRRITGLANLHAPLANSSVSLYNAKGEVILTGTTSAMGVVKLVAKERIDLPDARDGHALRIVLKGGTLHNAAFEGELAAEMPVWDDRGFHVNAVTNLIAVYLKQNPGLSHASASRRVESFLGMPLTDGQYVSVGSYAFSHQKFMSAAGNNLSGFTQQLANEMQGGTAQHLFRAQSVSASHPVLGAVSTDMVANIAADAAKALAQVTGGPLAVFGVTSLLQLTGFNSFFGDKTAAQLAEISNQLREIKNQLIELNSKVDALKSEVDALGKKVDLADYHGNMAQLDNYASQIHTSYLTLIQLNEAMIDRATATEPAAQALLDKQIQQYGARLKSDNLTLSAALLYLPEHPSQDGIEPNANNFSGFANKLLGNEAIGVAGLIPQWSKLVRGNSKVFYTQNEAQLVQQQWDYLDHILAEGMTLKINMLMGTDQPVVAQDSFHAWMQERTYLYSQVKGGVVQPQPLVVPLVDPFLLTTKNVTYAPTPHILPANTVIDQEWKTDKDRPGYTMYRTASDGQSPLLPDYTISNNMPKIDNDMSKINQVYTEARAKATEDTLLSGWFLPDVVYSGVGLDDPLPSYKAGARYCSTDFYGTRDFYREYTLTSTTDWNIVLPLQRDIADLNRKLKDAGGIKSVGFQSQGKIFASGLHCKGFPELGEVVKDYYTGGDWDRARIAFKTSVVADYNYNTLKDWDSLGVFIVGRNVLDGDTGEEKVIQYDKMPYGLMDIDAAYEASGEGWKSLAERYKRYLFFAYNYRFVFPENALKSTKNMDFFLMRRTNGIDANKNYYWY